MHVDNISFLQFNWLLAIVQKDRICPNTINTAQCDQVTKETIVHHTQYSLEHKMFVSRTLETLAHEKQLDTVATLLLEAYMSFE